MITFNVNNGYLEAIVRGYKKRMITQDVYSAMVQCDNLHDMVGILGSTGYEEMMGTVDDNPTTNAIYKVCLEQYVQQFKYLKSESVGELKEFLDYITHGYMIDNVIMLITNAMYESDVKSLLNKCHPLGYFEGIETLPNFSNTDELFISVLINTPLAPYFSKCLDSQRLNDQNIEVLRNKLYKEYIEDFHRFCKGLGGLAWDTMDPILRLEADHRIINITLNSFGTNLSSTERYNLYPDIGHLYDMAGEDLAKCDSADQIKAILATTPEYPDYFSSMDVNNTDKTIDDIMFREELELNKNVFMSQSNLAVFYSFFKLKEQEIRNIMWIAECIGQNQQDKINRYIPIF